MPSQFKIYTSVDTMGPGGVNGLSGSLIAVLNACLITGYGSGSYYKAPAGWTAPAPASASYTTYRPPSGSRMTMFVNDGYPSSPSYAEALFTGWHSVTNTCCHPGAASPGAMVGTSGSLGQFPTPTQLNTYGYLSIRKSATVDSTARQWLIAADEYTMYMWIWTGDTSTVYCHHFGFGDFYSFFGVSDVGRCLAYSKTLVQNPGGDITDCIGGGPSRQGYGHSTPVCYFPLYGHYIANSPIGAGGSVAVSKKGDCTLSSAGGTSTTNYAYNIMDGVYQYPQPYDNSLRLSPLWVAEPNTRTLRGRYRGLYHPLHPTTAFTNGQIISGSGDFVGKTFMMIQLGRNGGHWALETSPTLETNS